MARKQHEKATKHPFVFVSCFQMLWKHYSQCLISAQIVNSLVNFLSGMTLWGAGAAARRYNLRSARCSSSQVQNLCDRYTKCFSFVCFLINWLQIGNLHDKILATKMIHQQFYVNTYKQLFAHLQSTGCNVCSSSLLGLLDTVMKGWPK